MTTPVPRPYPPRPGPPSPGPSYAGPPPARTDAVPDGWDRPADPAASDGVGSGHAAVDAALQAIANGADLPPADQIAQYEAALRTLQETLATIDQA
nr:hypothetical protein [Micromonospora sp. DSM 115978]